MSSLSKWLKRTLFVLVIGVAYFSGYGVRLTHPIPEVGKTLDQNPVLVADAQLLGINYAEVNISFSDNLQASDVVNSTVIGLFHGPNTITIKKGLDKQTEVNTVAYEFMHYFWQNMSEKDKAPLVIAYQNYYNRDTAFKNLTKDYTGSPDILADERNSTACTRVQPYLLADEFNAYCNKFIQNRELLFNR